MTTVKIGSLQQATMVVGVVALATDADNGISSDSQVRCHCGFTYRTGKTRAKEPAFSQVTLNTGSYIDCN